MEAYDMRRLLLMTFLSALAVQIGKTDIQACGNKILSGGRGLRYRLMRSNNTASVLLYNDPTLHGDSRIRDPKLYSALKTAGHNFSVATDLNELEADLTTGKYDLVIADAAELASLKETVQAAPSNPQLIPILSGKKASEGDYIRYIDQALTSKRK
jgi:hypothetical protein